MPKHDRHLTKVGFNQLMLIDELVAEDRTKYIDRILIEGDTSAHILAISASDLEARLPDLIGYTNQGVCNVSKVMEVFLQATFGVPVLECDFTETENVLFEILNSPLILGLSARKLQYIAILPEVYLSIPYLLAGRSRPTRTSPILTCGVCHRRMKSVTTMEGLCSSCKGLLQEFTHWRAEPFYISRNYLNVPSLGSDKDPQDVVYTFEEWTFLNEANGITAEPTAPAPGEQRELPIKEYQKPIH